MANEIQKPNDILVSTLVNGNVDVMDLLRSGINADNTQLLDPQSYKESKLIKEKFTDDKGVFRDDLFNLYYEQAAKQYDELADLNSYNKLADYVEYNAKDIFAPLTSKKAKIEYEIEKEKNPLRRSHGVSHLFDYGDQTKSIRELAQMSKIWDSEKGEWLDKTADERGVLGSLFGQSLVYATYDEDTEEIDPNTGQKIKHKKGDWKLNEDGQYYTETIGNRSGYGKQFVAASDTLTKEDSTLNKFDFFDSDDIEKSLTGTVVKTAVQIIPYLIPGVNKVYGAITAGTNLLGVLPTFAKMCEGLVVSGNADNETAFTKTMNTWENYFKRYESSYSDDGMQKNWGAEKMLDQVSDIFALLYQMRAAASLSKFVTRRPEQEALKIFNEKYLSDVVTKGVLNGVNLSDKTVRDRLINTALQNMPEMQSLIAKQTKLSKGLSQAYMALISTSDVYEDALAGGYDRRMAGAAGLAAALGQFAIMSAEDKLNLGGWFLDESVGYSEGANRQALIKALRPHYDEIKKALGNVAEAGTKEEKSNILASTFGKIIHSIKNKGIDFSDGAQYLKNGVTEALEEMTEEAVMDATKGVFDVLSWAGVGNPNASFGVAEDFASGNFLERYLQNAVGGFMGGVLFEFQLNKIEPWIDSKLKGKKAQTEAPPELIREIQAGHAADLKKVVKELASLDSDVAAVPVDVNGKTMYQSANGQAVTRGQLTAQVLNSYIDLLEGYIVSENANLTPEQVFEKAVRDEEAIALIKDAKVDNLLIKDFSKLTGEIVAIRLALDSARAARTEADKKSEKSKEELEKDKKLEAQKAKDDFKLYNDNIDFSVTGWNDGKSVEFLENLLQSKREQMKLFLDGKKAEEYLEKAVLTSDPAIRATFGDFNLQEYTKYKYGVDFDKLNKTKGFVTQKSVEEEWNKWKAMTDPHQKFLKLGVPAYKQFMKKYSKSIASYGDKGYGDIRKLTIAQLFHYNNITMAEIMNNDLAYNIIKAVINSLKAKENDKQGDVALGSVFKQDRSVINSIVDRILNTDSRSIDLMKEFGFTKETLHEELASFLEDKLNLITIDNLSSDSLDALINGKLLAMMIEKIDTLLDKTSNKNLGEVQQLLQSKSLLKAGTDQLINGEDPLSIDKTSISRFIANNLDFDATQESVGFGTTVLLNALEDVDVIDGEVRLDIAKHALYQIKTILHNEEKNILHDSHDLASFQFGQVVFSITPNHLKQLRDLLDTKFDSNDTSLDSILKEWADPIVNKWIDDHEDIIGGIQDGKLSADEVFNGKLTDALVELVKNKLDQGNILKLYNKIKNKQVLNNSLLDMMRQTDDVLTKGKAAKILDIISQEEYKLRGATRFEEYMPKGEAKNLLLSAKTALGVLRALVEGMTDSPIGMNNPIAVNSILKRFAEKYKTGTESQYQTIDALIGQLISYDLDTIESRIDALLKLELRAYVNKESLEANIKKSFNSKMLEELHKLVRTKTFTSGTVSIAPQDEEFLQHTDPEEALTWFRVKLFENFKKEFHTPAERAAAIKDFINNLGIKSDDVTRDFKPLNLDRELESIQKADVLRFIIASLVADCRDFYSFYKSSIIDNPTIPITPLFSQEIDAYYAWAFGSDSAQVLDKHENIVTIHSFVLLTLQELNPDLLVAPALNEMFINGVMGAGKTTVMAGIVSRALKHKKQFFTAPNERQRIKLFNTAKGFHGDEADALESGSIDKLLEKFLTKEGVLELRKLILMAQDKKNHSPATQKLMPLLDFNTLKNNQGAYIVGINQDELKKYIRTDITVATLPQLIIIDEATQLVQPYHQVLNILALQYGMQIFALGDNTQMGASFGEDTQAFHDLWMTVLPKMNVSIRANNSQIGNNNYYGNIRIDYWDWLQLTKLPEDAIREFNSYILSNPLTYAYYESEDDFNGYKLVNSLEQGKETIELIAKLNDKKNKEPGESKQSVLIITDLDPKGNPVNANLKGFLAQHGLKELDCEFASYAKVHDLAVQGSEARYVIVDAGSYTSATINGEKSRVINTLLGRALSGAIMVVDEKTQEALNIINRKDSVTQIDVLPNSSDAQLKSRKEARSKELKKILKDYHASDPGKLSKEKKDDNIIYSRQNTTLPTITNKPTLSSDEKGNPESELEYSEEDQKSIVQAMNNSGLAVSKDELQEITEIETDREYYKETGGLLEETLNGASGLSVKPDDNTVARDSIALWLSMNHLNVPKHEYQEGYSYYNDGSHLDMDGLFDPNARQWINPAMATGFEKFRMLMIAALNKSNNEQELRSAIKTGIQESDEIAYFLAETVPAIAQNQAINVDYKSVSQYKQLYAEWFSQAVDVDEKFYVFAKPMEWNVDQPRNIARPNRDAAYEEGSPVLYYGIKISNAPIPNASDEANAFRKQYINQYISLGTLAKVTTKKGPIESQQLKDLYAKALTDLRTHNFVAYRLNSSSIFDLNITSTAWIRNTKGYYNGKFDIPFESLSSMHKRGFDVNEHEIYYLSNDMVSVPGRNKPVPVGLLTIAHLERKSTDITKPGNSEENLNDKLDRLEKLYVDPYTGEFRLAGHYLAFARCVDGNVSQSNLFNRVVFLDAATFSASAVLSDMVFVPTEKDKKKPNWRTKAAKCDPNSLKLLLTALLGHCGVFEQSKNANLLKFLIGMRDAIRDTTELISENGITKPKDSIYANDLLVLNELIEYVNNKLKVNEPILKFDFYNQLRRKDVRLILLPFCLKFITRVGITDEYHIKAVEDTGATIVGINDISSATLQLNPSNNFHPLDLSKDHMPNSKGCPAFVKGGQKVNVLERLGVNIEGVDSKSLGMFKIAWDPDVTPNTIGLLGYQIQAPLAQVKNSSLDLNSIETITTPLEQCGVDEKGRDLRFPTARKGYINIPNDVDKYDKKDVKAQVLDRNKGYYIDKSEAYSKFVGTSKGNLKGYYLKDKNGKFIKKDGRLEIHELTDPKKLPKNAVPIYWKNNTGTYGKLENGKDLNVIDPVTGILVRPGDFVQVLGHKNRAYYVETVNTDSPTGIMIRLSAATKEGDGYASGDEPKSNMELFFGEDGKPISKEIPLSHISAVVKRAIVDTKHIDQDYYQHPEKFTEGEVLENGKYKALYKTVDTFNEIVEAVLNGKHLNTLHFNTSTEGVPSYYMIRPLNQDQIDTDNIQRLPQSVDGKFNMMDELLTPESLKQKIAEYQANPAIKGFVLYHIERHWGEGRTEELTQKLLSDMNTTITNALMHGNTSRYVAHVVLKEDSEVEKRVNGAIVNDIANVPYDRNEIPKLEPDPSELLPLVEKDGKVSIDIAKILESLKKQRTAPKILTRSQFQEIWDTQSKVLENDQKYPSTKWMYILEGDQYHMYPLPGFLFGTTKLSENTYQKYLTTTEGVTEETYLKFLMRGESPAAMEQYWTNLLQGLLIVDYQAHEYFDPVTPPDNVPNKDEWAKQERVRRFKQRSVLNYNRRSTLDASKHFEIIGVVHKGSSEVKDLQIALKRIGTDPTIYYVPLTHFIQQIGLRFDFMDTSDVGTAKSTTALFIEYNDDPLFEEKTENANDRSLFNLQAISNDIGYVIGNKTRRDNNGYNRSLRLFLKSDPGKGYFELVKDDESDYYSIHFKTNNGDGTGRFDINVSTPEERLQLYNALLAAIPLGAKFSTWGSLTINGYNAIINMGSRFTNINKVEERSEGVSLKGDSNTSITIPVYEKLTQDEAVRTNMPMESSESNEDLASNISGSNLDQESSTDLNTLINSEGQLKSILTSLGLDLSSSTSMEKLNILTKILYISLSINGYNQEVELPVSFNGEWVKNFINNTESMKWLTRNILDPITTGSNLNLNIKSNLASFRLLQALLLNPEIGFSKSSLDEIKKFAIKKLPNGKKIVHISNEDVNKFVSELLKINPEKLIKCN